MKQKAEKIIISIKSSCLLYFLKSMHIGVLSIKDVAKKQSKLFRELGEISKGGKAVLKSHF